MPHTVSMNATRVHSSAWRFTVFFLVVFVLVVATGPDEALVRVTAVRELEGEAPAVVRSLDLASAAAGGEALSWSVPIEISSGF